jgi:hypothetical protein
MKHKTEAEVSKAHKHFIASVRNEKQVSHQINRSQILRSKLNGKITLQVL